ncbi:SDR family NAD(P)-dependent oxidoreductase [Aerococcus mictus]|uniref:SDR family oxidoreductase n=1 Tax=Aerococcus TaxID=1375 RepID=UPI0008C6ED12|nr:SDR family oxidoreductase [Aerococcus urinae]KAA9293623.1 SDR family oxidoreductase [Aerococcus mictus]OFM51876.1 3-oxoacyl-ACP reductase [Aerococcus mictus]PKY81842.1 KR domain-containing protein [Aerococcus mictus]PMB92993.1 KR domain-containing protein [Aerococcus mictus]RAV62860.1 SDR family NAD(P)-dependent oxidoreductase [Aerococcus mictus]
MSNLLAGKVVLISGSSRGIGAAIAKGFAKSGANVVINYRKSEEQARAVADYCTSQGIQAILAKGDVTRQEGVHQVVKKTLDNFGRLDVLVNNVFSPFQFDAEKRKKVWQLSWEDYERQLEGGLKSTYLLTQAVLETMMENNSGSIINMVSNLVADPVVPYADYITTKAGIVGYTKSMAKDLGVFNIRVNGVAPGLVYPTDSTKTTKEILKEKIIESTPLARMVQVEDVVGPVLFLASDWSKMMTGQILYVDGGLVMPG